MDGFKVSTVVVSNGPRPIQNLDPPHRGRRPLRPSGGLLRLPIRPANVERRDGGRAATGGEKERWQAEDDPPHLGGGLDATPQKTADQGMVEEGHDRRRDRGTGGRGSEAAHEKGCRWGIATSLICS